MLQCPCLSYLVALDCLAGMHVRYPAITPDLFPRSSRQWACRHCLQTFCSCSSINSLVHGQARPGGNSTSHWNNWNLGSVYVPKQHYCKSPRQFGQTSRLCSNCCNWLRATSSVCGNTFMCQLIVYVSISRAPTWSPERLSRQWSWC